MIHNITIENAELPGAYLLGCLWKDKQGSVYMIVTSEQAGRYNLLHLNMARVVHDEPFSNIKCMIEAGVNKAPLTYLGMQGSFQIKVTNK